MKSCVRLCSYILLRCFLDGSIYITLLGNLRHVREVCHSLWLKKRWTKQTILQDNLSLSETRRKDFQATNCSAWYKLRPTVLRSVIKTGDQQRKGAASIVFCLPLCRPAVRAEGVRADLKSLESNRKMHETSGFSETMYGTTQCHKT
jgi:hypothetical protein